MTYWAPLLIGLGIKIGVETVILTIALWIMIKAQKLNYHFPGLLGAAALTSGLDEILNRSLDPVLGIYLASYISTPVAVAVLFICITRLTRADQVDVFFTIGVGYAIWFCLNLWLLGALMGDLSPSTRPAGNEAGAAGLPAKYRTPNTNRLAAPSPMTNKAAGSVARPPGNPGEPVPANLVSETIKSLSLKGIISAGKPSAMISTGVKTYTLFPGDSLDLETAHGKVAVRCEKLEKDRVILNVAGEPVTLSLPTATP
jgi:hypothetical protein